MAQQHISCPTCHTQIDIEDVLSQSIEQRLKADYEQRLLKAIEAEKQAAVKVERERTDARVAALERENAEKTAALKTARETEIQVLELKRKLQEKDEETENIIRKKMLESQSTIEASIRKAEAEKYELREREWQQKMDAAMRQTEELKRKMEQGSQQLSGEVQELAIEEYLRSTFPTDEVLEIKKGFAGADCVHRVLVQGNPIGSILYESKRTKQFQPSWIEKFKEDIRAQGADVGVLVTETLPKDVQSFGLMNGVFVCSYTEYKALAHVVRELVVRVGEITTAQENRGDKMELLYSYLTSADFRMSIEAIVEAFQTMHSDLQKERASMERLWKQREKQIDKVLLSTTRLYGSIKGIAGADVAEVKQLELDSTRTIESDRLDFT